MSADTATLTFEAPGPGAWKLDPVHFPRPATRYWAEMHPPAFKRGFQDMTAFYGLLLDYNELAYINGFMYACGRIVAESEIPKRFQRADEVFAGKLWREQLRVWDDEAKPAAIRTHREIQSIDPDTLSDTDLATHLGRARDHHADMIAQHMRFTGAATIPVGDLMAHAMEWTGLPPARLLGMMRGAAEVSGGGSPQHDRMIATMRADSAARALLEADGDPAKVLDEVRSLDSDAGRAFDDYLELAGFRLLDGFDISGRYALEAPDAFLRAIRASVAGRDAEGGDVEDLIADIRQQVPEAHRAEFDELLGEARFTYRIRDERGVYSDIWASGLVRRAAMSAGRRLLARGRISDAEHFVHAGFDEMVELLVGTGGPSADELAARHAYQTTRTAKEAPAFVGDEPTPPPDPSTLPPGAGRLMRAMGFAMSAMFEDSTEEHEESVIKGLAASPGTYEGPARIVANRTDFDRITKGDVLVTESTTEAFNILLPLLGGLVTDSGGLLSHAAIVSREYAIPGVVGTRDATQRIADGTIVRVDGDAGEVTIRT